MLFDMLKFCVSRLFVVSVLCRIVLLFINCMCGVLVVCGGLLCSR